MVMTVQETLAEFVHDLEYDDLSDEVRKRTKYCLLDYIACALVGSRTLLAEKYYLLGKRMGGTPESVMIGDGGLVPAIWAATTNSTIGHIHELDDSCPGGGHAGTVTIPAALAIGDREESTGKELITSIVVGYEIACRIGRSFGPSHRRRGFHSTSTFSTFGATAAAGKLLGLDNEELARALGIACVQATGILELHKGRSMLKPVQVGKASGNGVLSVLLAKTGVPASVTILEQNYTKSFSNGDVDIGKMTRSLGRDFAIMNTSVKFHPSCAHTHKAIEAAIALKKQHHIEPSNVKKITVRSYTYASRYMGGPDRYKPETMTAAKFSIPYLVALVIDHGKVDVGDFVSDKLKNKKILDLMQKIEVVGDPAMDKIASRPQEVTVNMIDGSEYICLVDTTRGEPGVISFVDIEKKFKSLAERALLRREADVLQEKVLHLEELSNMRDLRPYLATDRFSRPCLQ